MTKQQQTTERILHAKRERLQERQKKTPFNAVLRLAEMQESPAPLLNIVTAGRTVTLLGQVHYEDIYDPVAQALKACRYGVEAIAFYTDSQVYDSGLDDLLLVCRGLKRPVLYQNFILDEYHVAEARASGAASLTLYASVLSAQMLRRTVSMTQRWRMSAVVQVENREQLDSARDLSPHVICAGIPNENDTEKELAILEDLRPHIPRFSQSMLFTPLHDLEHVRHALELGVDALILDNALLTNFQTLGEIHRLVQLRSIMKR